MVRNNAEGSKFEFRHGAIKFSEAVHTVTGVGDNNHGTEIVRMTFDIRGGFDLFIEYENE